MALHFDTSPFGTTSKYPRSPGTFREVKATPTARSKKKVQIQVSNHIDIDYVDAPDAASRILVAAKGLEDANLVIENEESYGSSSIVTYISGWRDATDQEIEDRKDYEAFLQEERAKHLERQAEALKRERPDLFK